MAPSAAAAKQIQERLAKLPEVSRTFSLDTFIPDDQPAKLAIIRKAAASLNPILNETSRGTAPSDEENIAALKGSVESLRKTAGDDKGPGAVAARRLADALDKLAQAEKATREKATATFISPLNVALDQVRGLLKAQPVSVKTLPPDILQDWTSADGQNTRRSAAEGRSQRQRYLARFRGCGSESSA